MGTPPALHPQHMSLEYILHGLGTATSGQAQVSHLFSEPSDVAGACLQQLGSALGHVQRAKPCGLL